MAWQPDYISADALAEALRIDDDLDEAELQRAVTAASRAIDRHTCRQFGLVDEPEPRYYRPRWSRTRGRWLVPIDDLMTETGFEVAVEQYAAGVYVAVADAVLRPRNAAAEGKPWVELALPATAAVGPLFGDPDSCRVTARFGWTTSPVAVEQAALLQASRLFARRDAPFGVAGSPEAGSEMRLLAKVDPDVAVSLDLYRRRVWAR